ncbi:hypothetical protein AGMMS49944_26090 [Spirochaetia bacterium]|nr:hypothetical protein AGMMS49944_26090 [Spirochaetia bacterium]
MGVSGFCPISIPGNDLRAFTIIHIRIQVEEKLAMLADIDKAYLRGYLDRAAFTRFADLPKTSPQDNLSGGQPKA